MREEKKFLKFEVSLEICADRTNAKMSLQQRTESGKPIGKSHSETVTANGSPEMAANILGGRIKQAVVDGIFMFT